MHKCLKLVKVVLILVIIGLAGFKDTGVFVKDYMAKGERKFEQNNEVTVIRDKGREYTIIADNEVYEITKENILVTHKDTKNYAVKTDTFISDRFTNTTEIKKGDILELLELCEEGYNKYKTKGGLEGYVKAEDLDMVIVHVMNLGLAQVNISVKEGNDEYKVKIGEQVDIAGFKDGKYILRDTKGKDFMVSEKDIKIQSQGTKKVSRGLVERELSNERLRSEKIEKVIQAGERALGVRYVWGGTSKSGYDCSGFTQMVYMEGAGIKLDRVSQDQSRNGVNVNRPDLIRGDLIFFKTTSREIGHVGVYLGGNKFIHASSGVGSVIISDINEIYYKTRYITARRIIK